MFSSVDYYIQVDYLCLLKMFLVKLNYYCIVVHINGCTTVFGILNYIINYYINMLVELITIF